MDGAFLRVETVMSRLVLGQPISPGTVMGSAFVVPRSDEDLFKDSTPSPPGDMESLRRAAGRTRDQLARFQKQLEDRLQEDVGQIFRAHVILMDDPRIMGAIEDRVRDGTHARDAIHEVLGGQIRRFAESPSPAVREKAADLRDLCRRLLENLDGREASSPDLQGRILIVTDALPSDILRHVAQGAGGIILAGGGVTAHIGVLARSLQIPMAVANPEKVSGVETGTPLILDGDQGFVHIHPDPEAVKGFRSLIEARAALDRGRPPIAPETRTRDGVRIRLLANIGLISEVRIARDYRAEGIGLYRSEIPFVIRQDFPSEDEQVRVYRAILDGMEGAEVTLRALDIGGDKMLSYFPQADQANPFLGLRGFRFLIRHPDIFKRQLRAMLRAGEGRDLSIMFPLIASVDGFLRTREITDECAAGLASEGIPHNPRPRLGAMVELPSAVGVVDELAAVCDFLSIGSNDLVQYMLAVDRTNAGVADWYLPWHPAVLRAIRSVIEAGRRNGKSVSICGDMARDPKMIPLLVGMGIPALSVPPQAIPVAQQVIQELDAAEAAERTRRILALGRIREVADALGIDWVPPSMKRL
jgi:phosphotransferase system enzyme I (PtsP)